MTHDEALTVHEGDTITALRTTTFYKKGEKLVVIRVTVSDQHWIAHCHNKLGMEVSCNLSNFTAQKSGWDKFVDAVKTFFS